MVNFIDTTSHGLTCCITFLVSGVKYLDRNSTGWDYFFLQLEYIVPQEGSHGNRSPRWLVTLHPQSGSIDR